MNFIIRAENLDLSKALREYIEKKVGRIDKYFDQQIVSNVYTSLKVYRDQHCVEVTIPMTNLILRAEEKNEDMYASIDLVVDKLERQIRKYKTKINRKARTNGSLKQILNNQFIDHIELEDDEEKDFEIVRTKRFSIKPMEPEEAILQMNMLGHNFFVFKDANEKINVVYRRNNGKYGLIETEIGLGN